MLPSRRRQSMFRRARPIRGRVDNVKTEVTSPPSLCSISSPWHSVMPSFKCDAIGISHSSINIRTFCRLSSSVVIRCVCAIDEREDLRLPAYSRVPIANLSSDSIQKQHQHGNEPEVTYLSRSDGNHRQCMQSVHKMLRPSARVHSP